MENIEDLNYLLNAKSRDVVVSLCQECFTCRHEGRVTDQRSVKVAKTLGVKAVEASKMIISLTNLIREAVYQGTVNITAAEINKDLRGLLTKILNEHMEGWREQARTDTVHLPHLVDFDWRVDIKTSSDSLSRMSVPSCILQLKVEDPANVKTTEGTSATSTHNVELSKETLDTMLDGLGKIRDQLGSVANQGAS